MSTSTTTLISPEQERQLTQALERLGTVSKDLCEQAKGFLGSRSWKVISALSSVNLAALSGYVAAGVFTSIHPLGGAVFGATGVLANLGLQFAEEKLGIAPRNPVLKTAIAAARIITAIGTAALLTAALGFAVSPLSAVVLPAAMIATTVTICVSVGASFFTTALPIGVGIWDAIYSSDVAGSTRSRMQAAAEEVTVGVHSITEEVSLEGLTAEVLSGLDNQLDS